MEIKKKKDEFYLEFEDDKEEELFEEFACELLNESIDVMDKVYQDTFNKSSKDINGRTINLEKEIDKVTFNNPATVVFWKDGTKTVTKCQKCDTFNKETGLAMCIIRKLCGNRNYHKAFEKFCS